MGVEWMECEEVSSHLWEYLDEELEPEEADSIGEHLRECPWCRTAYCCRRAFLDLLARQRDTCMTPRTLMIRLRRLSRL